MNKVRTGNDFKC